MRKADKFPRNVHALRLNDYECDLIQMISQKHGCKSFSECIRLLILREADRIVNDDRTIEAERKLTTW